MGCTEPIAIAYAAAKAADVLGRRPDKITARVSGDGIVKHGVEKTIETVGKLARHGMKATDEEIIRLMLED